MRASEWCINHDPDQAEARKRRGSKGGKRGGRGRPAAEIPAIKAQLQQLIDDVLAGDQDRGAAAVAGNLFNALLRAVEVERKVKETEDLERRLEALEERLTGGTRWRA